MRGCKKLAVILCLLCGICSLSGCGCKHKEWQDADCTTPKTCADCGNTEGEPLGHDWADATCTAPKTCQCCGETEGETGDHTTHSGKCEDCGEFILDEAFIPDEVDYTNTMMYNYMSVDFSHTILDVESSGTSGFSAHVNIPSAERISGVKHDEDFDYVLHYYGTQSSNCLWQLYMYLETEDSADAEPLYEAVKAVMNGRYGSPEETFDKDGEEMAVIWYNDNDTLQISIMVNEGAVVITLEIVDFPF